MNNFKNYSKNKGNKNSNYSKNSYMGNMSIDINALERKLDLEFNKRKALQVRYDQYWNAVKRGNNRSNQIRSISDEIGNSTHRINELIAKLCQYKKTHRAMNKAYDYISGEIRRIEKIVSSWDNTINEVERGYKTLITSEGITTTDTASSRRYVALKRSQLSVLRGWLNHVDHYRVR